MNELGIKTDDADGGDEFERQIAAAEALGVQSQPPPKSTYSTYYRTRKEAADALLR